MCFRRGADIYRLVWLNESQNGIYVGLLGAAQEVHYSYHRDGKRHTKIDGEKVHPSADIAIHDSSGIRQLLNMSIYVGGGWLSAANVYAGDEKTETVVLLDERLFSETRRCSVDVWLLDRHSETELLGRIGAALAGQAAFAIVGEVIVALDHFPDHKIGITLRAEPPPVSKLA